MEKMTTPSYLLQVHVLPLSLLLARYGQIALDHGLVDAEDGEPEEVAADDHAPEGVADSHIWVEATKKNKRSETPLK